ncbi:hypothetical protein LZ32DRAFT_655970 [Colletotrichum eremochloae]|nr:hypothetical protein LZ32DRAFT_655970 [Colletotrichum eremochloae]
MAFLTQPAIMGHVPGTTPAGFRTTGVSVIHSVKGAREGVYRWSHTEHVKPANILV